MTGFPKSVNIYPSIGIPGAFASNNPITSTPLGYVAGADLPIGGFCWEDSSNPGEVKPSGSGAPLGFVCREFSNTIYSQDEAQNFVPEGANASIMVEGDFYVFVAEAVTKGQKVFTSTTNGSIKGAATGSSVPGYVETPFTFATASESNGIAIISSNVISAIAASTTPAEYVTGITGAGATITVTKNTGSSTITVDNVANATTAGKCTGNAATADKLKTARDITLTGVAKGSGSFDGSANVTINTTA